jgi:signal transduction histidine kinase
MDTADLGTAVVDVLSATDPRDIRARLVRLALEETHADRCTLTSIDGGVFRVEESLEHDGRPAFVGREYPLSYLDTQPLLAEALATGEVVTGGSLASKGRSAPELDAPLQAMKQTAIVPLRLGFDVGAFFVLSRRRDEPFTASQLQWVGDMGGMAVLALRNARLVEGVTSAQRRGLDALTLFSENLAASGSRTSFFGLMSKTVAGLSAARRVAFWLIDGDQLAVQRDAFGFTDADTATMTMSVPDARRAGLFGVLHTGEALRYTRRTPDDTPPARVAPPNTTNFLAVPWRTSEGPLGMLVAYDSAAGFSDQDEWIVRLAARASALVLQSYEAQQRLEQLQDAESDRLREHSMRMAAVDQRKSDFLKLASHELRGPLTLLGGYLSMLVDGTTAAVPPSLLPQLERMQSQVKRMNELVSQMLAAARLEDGQLLLDPREARVDDVIRDVVRGTDPRSHRIIIESMPPVLAYTDKRHLALIIGNLLSNAIKYSPDGGDITIRVDHDDTMVEVEVSDQGIGIEPAQVGSLFRPFSRLKDAESRGIDGVGLGLYLSRELARAQDGDITVRSEPGHGSVFTLRLPRRRLARRTPRTGH